MSTAISLERNTGLISAGTHTFQILKFSEEEGKSGPYWRYSVACTDQGDDRGKQALLQLSLSEQARFRVDEFLDAMNAPKKGTATGESFVGRTFKAVVTHREYEGRTTVDMSKLSPTGDTGQFKMPEPVGRPNPSKPAGRGIPDDVVADKDEEDIPF